MTLAGRFLFLILMVCSLVGPVVAETDCAPPERPVRDIDRAVSLKALERHIRECGADRDCSADARRLFGLAQIDGVLADPETRDVVLIGHRDPDAVALDLDDFVVMLRNALGHYAKREDNTLFYTAPGVSIDPRPETLSRLEDLANRPGGLGEMVSDWPAFCETEQDVRILGIPRTRAAGVMLEADYLMKRFVNGQMPIDLPDHNSLSDLSMEAAKQAALSDRDESPIGGLTRFWFAAGPYTVSEDAGVTMLGTTPVALLDEAELLTRQGEIVAAGETNPLARRFSCSFSRNYPRIAAHPDYSIYSDLSAVFRWAAIARLMVDTGLFRQAGYRPDWLITDYPVAQNDLPATLPGVSEIRRWPEPGTPEFDSSRIRLALPSCGGVSVDFSGIGGRVQADGSGRLAQMREIVLFYRDDLARIFWDIFL